MLERINLKELELFILIAFIVVTGLITAYYIVIIQQGSQYAKDEYDCSDEFRIASNIRPVSNASEAKQVIKEYLAERNITLSSDSLDVIGVSGTYKVRVPESLYSERHCTFRKAGTEPPACVGKWFTVDGQTIKMEYGSPC